MKPPFAFLACALSLASCSREPLPPGVLAEHALLLNVSPNQDFLLYLTNPPSEGTDGFDVWLQPLPTGDAIELAWDQTRIAGSTVLGSDRLWTRQLGSSWSFGAPVDNLDITPDGRALVYFQGPHTGPVPTGAIKFVDVDQCRDGTCHPRTLIDGVRLSIPALSPDHRFAAVMADDLTLFDLTQSTSTVLAPLPSGYVLNAPPTFSRDGTLLAVTPLTSGSSLLQVYSTATATQLPWPALPAGYSWGQVEFLDDGSIFARVEEAHDQSWATYRITASEVTPLVMGPSTPTAGTIGSRYVLSSDGTTVLVSDIGAPRAAPVTLSTSSAGLAGWNDALTKIAFFEGPQAPPNYRAQLVLASLPDGQRLATFADVSTLLEGGGVLGSAAALAGDALVYLDGVADQGQGGTLHVWRDGVDHVIGDGISDFRTGSAPDTLYYTVTGTRSGYGPWLTGSIHHVPLP